MAGVNALGLRLSITADHARQAAESLEAMCRAFMAVAKQLEEMFPTWKVIGLAEPPADWVAWLGAAWRIRIGRVPPRRGAGGSRSRRTSLALREAWRAFVGEVN